MSITYVSGIPPVVLDTAALEYLEYHDPANTALHVAVDPPTGVTTVSIFFDDGHGNGNCILSLPLCELRALAKRLKEQVDA